MTAPYSYWHNDSMPFIPNQTTKRINLIDAFNKKFIFYYTAEANSPNVSFLIFLLGRKVDAQKYLIDFELKQNLRKVKFVDNCPCDTDNLDQMIEENRCITISKNIVETFLNDGNINFRFIIKRRDLFEAEELKKERYVKQHPLPAATDAADKLKPQQPPQPLQRQQLQQRQPMQRPQQPMNMMFRSPLMMREKRSLPLQNTKWKQSHISNQSPVVNILRDARGSADVMTSGGSNGGGAAFQSDDGRYRRPVSMIYDVIAFEWIDVKIAVLHSFSRNPRIGFSRNDTTTRKNWDPMNNGIDWNYSSNVMLLWRITIKLWKIENQTGRWIEDRTGE